MKTLEKQRKKIRRHLRTGAGNIFDFLKVFVESGEVDEIISAAAMELENEKNPVKAALLRLLRARMFFQKGMTRELELETKHIFEKKRISFKLKAHGWYLCANSRLVAGDYSGADGMVKKALALAVEREDELFALTLNTMGALHSYQDRPLVALSYYEKFSRVARHIGSNRLISTALNNTGVILSKLGKFDEAIIRFVEAQDFALKENDRLQLGYTLCNLAEQYLAIRDYDQARKCAQKALSIFEEIDIKPMEASAEHVLGHVFLKTGNPVAASEHAAKALSISGRGGTWDKLAMIHRLVGEILAVQENSLAKEHFEKSIKIYRDNSPKDTSPGVEYTLLEYGKFLIAKGNNAGKNMLREAMGVLARRRMTMPVKNAIDEAQKLLSPFSQENLEYFLRKIDESCREKEAFRRILDISRAMSSQVDMAGLAGVVVDRGIEICGAERGFMLLVEKDGYSYPVTRNFYREIPEAQEFGFIKTVLEQCIEAHKSLIVSNTDENIEMHNLDKLVPETVKAVFVLPVMVGGKVVGVVYMDSRVPVLDNRPGLETSLERLVEQAAIMVERTRLYEELRGLNEKLDRQLERRSEQLEKVRVELENRQKELETRYSYSSIVGASVKMQELFSLLDKVVETDFPVLIQGESGTGKELVARAIHFNGARKKNGFVAINCSAIPEGLLESELFGYVKGAFTGADSTKKGLFEAADGGTVMLDEIGDMSLSMQQKLLRVVQEGEIRRLGSNIPVKINVRLISASNRNLRALVDNVEFREDLFYRLNVVTLTLPPLRDRKSDIPLLVEHFWKKATNKNLELEPGAKAELFQYLLDYDWPGNVRELENEVNRFALLSGGKPSIRFLSEHVIEKGIRGSGFGDNLLEHGSFVISELEKRTIKAAMTNTRGNKSKAAKLLGIPRTTLYTKLAKYNIGSQS